ncbi:hypothetical protein HU750_16640 [Pseudomonas sp. SWRI50]|uniref:hypothetical protein n=1 Tax=Pseudomonas sp. SWRI50 TaxID=2745484 RepID=UPI0016456039|nr:hypothetical protein [Pseudomonas sp. SWRI50]MBC3487296.1 hypothetical protein [Pseudomonas sp. SWRI50]
MSKGSNRLLFFYQGNKLITVNQGDHHRAIFRSADTPLGEQKKSPLFKSRFITQESHQSQQLIC